MASEREVNKIDRQQLWVTESEPIGGEAVIPSHFQLRKWVWNDRAKTFGRDQVNTLR